MKHFLILVGLLFLPLISVAQLSEPPSMPDRGDSLDALIPDGWYLLDSATGDLDKDNLKDLVLIVEAEGEYGGLWGAPRVLVVYFGCKEGGYRYSVMAENIVLLRGEGGMLGDPFQEIEVNRGSFAISFYGGSSWRWGMSYRFRFQERKWYLIGATEFSLSLHTGELDITDYNLLTGEMEMSRSYVLIPRCEPCEDCNDCKTCEECGECETLAEDQIVHKNIPRRPLPLLESFETGSWSIPEQ